MKTNASVVVGASGQPQRRSSDTAPVSFDLEETGSQLFREFAGSHRHQEELPVLRVGGERRGAINLLHRGLNILD